MKMSVSFIKRFVVFLCLFLLLLPICASSGNAANIPDGLEYVIEAGEMAVYYRGKATTLVIPENIGGYPVTSLYDRAFLRCTSLTSITLPDSINVIGEHAFEDCTNLTSITIPKGVTSIEYGTFYDCENLTSITIPDSVIYIGDLAFKNCTSLTDITIPNGVTYIGEGAFSGCESLTGSITIPDGVTSIENATFQNCWNLTNIIIPDSVTSIGDWAFYGCGLTSLNIPSSVTSFDAAYLGGSLKSITVSPDNPIFTSIDGVLFNKEGTLLINYPTKRTADSYTIPDSVTTIGQSSFGGCSNLTSITIPNSVTSIGTSAFESCRNLTSITIPNGVTAIGAYAFFNCKHLTSITIPSSVIAIGNGDPMYNDTVFSGCDNLTIYVEQDSYALEWCLDNGFREKMQFIPSEDTSSIPAGLGYSIHDGKVSIINYTGNDEVLIIPAVIEGYPVNTIEVNAFLGCMQLASITIPDSVTSIEFGNFSVCPSLTSFIIPDSVTSIGSSAFFHCENLTNITIPSSVTSIGSSVFILCDNLTTINVEQDSYAHQWCIDNGLESKVQFY